MLTLPHYQIGSQIYESVNSLVYRGHRKKDNKPIILKMLKQDYPTPAELTRYRQEYEITHDLNLAGVIKAYGIEKYQNTLVIILDDFGGESLKQVMANQTLTLKAFLPIAIKIADSLGNIHAANIIHKDINPSNIIVNIETNQLKIIDFGIASHLPRENPTLKNPEQLEGSLAYLSPEQTGRMNRSLDYRTDLYSLGVTFYELLIGKVPFESDSAMELVHCHIAKTPKPVCEVNPNVPPIISDIIMKLMAKNVEDRYQSAFGVKADLEKCQENLTGLEDLSGLSFQIAQNDFSGKLQIPQKLYGRENEINILLQAFERVSEGAAEMMLVAGYSGVGKTALVHEVHKPMTEKHGYFASGKFDQFQKNIPYSAITQAFNQFCRYLLMESAETLANWQMRILDAVGNNGQIIIDVIPDLELIIGTQPKVASVGPTEAQNRFQMFFLNFVKALCNKDHPFILFIDDLQWVDSGSLALLKSIMLDDEIQHLLIIGAYRDNEVDSSHQFIMAVDELQKANAVINTIELANLLSKDINHLLQDSLKCETTQPLTDLIYQKTQGNAFFTHQFLHTLYFEALLRFDFEQLKWQWDVEQIAAQKITDNVVDLMANKIDKLPLETSKALQLAACMGNQFDLPILAIIYEHDKNETLEVLHPAVAEGLILPLDENYKHLEVDEKATFKFLHDRVQQAAYARIDDEQKKAVHLKIGRLLLEKTPPETLAEHLFDIVEHLNQGSDLLDNQNEKNKLARMNLKAGQKAKLATAYSAAVKFLSVGLKCLQKNGWQTEYDLTLTLYSETAEAAFLSGNNEQMAQLTSVVLHQAKTQSDKLKVYEVRIQAYVTTNKQLDVVKFILKVLKEMNLEFPDNPGETDFLQGLQKTQSILAGKQIEELAKLPKMTEPSMLAAMHLMKSIVPASYQAMPSLFPLLSFKQIELSIRYGNSPMSALSYAFYGIILCGINDIDTGHRFGKLALSVYEYFGNKEIQTAVMHLVNGFINHWTEHVVTIIPFLEQGFQSGLDTGDFQYAGYAANFISFFQLMAGKELSELERDITAYSNKLKILGLETSHHLNEANRQVVLNLMRHSKNPSSLAGEAYQDEKMLPLHLEANDQYTLAHIYFFKLLLCYLFEKCHQAIENAILVEKYLNGVTGLLIVPSFYFFNSLARLAVYKNSSESTQKSILESVDANQEKMRIWAQHAPMNRQHKYDLVEAEKARILGQVVEAMDFYEKAIVGAKDNEYLQEEALAYELAAKFYLGRGMAKIAQTYLTEAHYRYQQWGALAKVKDLEIRYPQFLAPKTARAIPTNATISVTKMASTSTKSGSDWLDLNSIMKAAQTLSGEIVLSQLLEKMMHIVIENAGAEKGVLLLPQNDNWFIEAQGQVDSEAVKVLQSIPLENQSIAQTIIHYVERTQENVVLQDATQEGQFTHDPYIVEQRPKSILCLPLLNQGQLTGILYLENHLATGAFTQERLNVLNLLSSQIAISIENARLYTNITQLNQAYKRFVPHEFLSLLEKQSIIEVQLGDQIEKEMTILFSDIRDFTSLSEKMTPQDNFEFINAYLGQMEPIIHEYQGIIDKYIGDAIMALFPTSADHALKGAIAMLKALVKYNEILQYTEFETIRIGIGLHTGKLMLGTIGGQNRMDGTVISDAVNLASRIEGMTKMYGAALLISEETYTHLSDVSQYAIRTIDRVKVKGKSEPVTIYEVFDADAPCLFDLKMKTLDEFEEGLAHYRQKAFAEAIAGFERVLKTNPNDKAAQIYLKRCLHWQKVGIPDNWAGVEALDSK